MRKFVLALIVGLIGFVGTASGEVSAERLESSDIALVNNETDNATLTIDVTDLREDINVHVIICSTDESMDCGFDDRATLTRWICYSRVGSNFDSDCTTFPTSPITIELFKQSQWNDSSSTGVLQPGIYEVKVVVYDPSQNTGNEYGYPFVEFFSNSQFRFTYDKEPKISGDNVVGATLKVEMPTWTPTPSFTSIRWVRCKTTVKSYWRNFNDVAPYVTSFLFENDATCSYIGNDGLLITPLGIVSTQNVTGSIAYTVTEADLGYSIGVLIEVYGLVESREFGVASTPVIEKKTAPVNQVAPTSTFTKTKKIKKLQVGATVAATPGTWKWANATTFQWYNCTKKQRSTTEVNAKQCKAIKRATKATYKTKKTDKGRFLVVQVTATNELGSTVIYATSLGKIK